MFSLGWISATPVCRLHVVNIISIAFGFNALHWCLLVFKITLLCWAVFWSLDLLITCMPINPLLLVYNLKLSSSLSSSTQLQLSYSFCISSQFIFSIICRFRNQTLLRPHPCLNFGQYQSTFLTAWSISFHSFSEFLNERWHLLGAEVLCWGSCLFFSEISLDDLQRGHFGAVLQWMAGDWEGTLS